MGMWKAAFFVSAIETLAYECELIRNDDPIGIMIGLLPFTAPLIWLVLSFRTGMILLLASLFADDDGWQFVFVAGSIGGMVGIVTMVPILNHIYRDSNRDSWIGFIYAVAFATSQVVAALIFLRKRRQLANSPLNKGRAKNGAPVS
jgi:hypothetical protein